MEQGTAKGCRLVETKDGKVIQCDEEIITPTDVWKRGIDLSKVDINAMEKQEIYKEAYNTVTLNHEERVIVEEHERLSPHLIFEIIRRDGIEELLRPVKALVFSGIGAGIMITFSFVCMAVLAALLPKESWSPIISKMGYTIGFILVILARAQLFTENTITTVVPLFKPFKFKKLCPLGRLWTIVLLSNLIGTTLAASFLSIDGVMNPEFVVQMELIASHVAHMSAYENLIRGIPSGILIAAIVWMMPSARNFSFFIIAFFTYFIALGDFTHIVVGSAEMCYAVIHGMATIGDYFFTFLIPTGIGNILGGTGVFTLLAYAQISSELNVKH
ncbi:formate/nitrite transporter family protein [Veillonella montpellierensis]|uniref:formate/nitrite transporter family protein n=1 Tax=Veillonella montpellierensis TaxID=187328 RepID=UPI0023F700C1|nr:formate/nitrite transporter family protein [Veillonella montpellierensis]